MKNEICPLLKKSKKEKVLTSLDQELIDEVRRTCKKNKLKISQAASFGLTHFLDHMKKVEVSKKDILRKIKEIAQRDFEKGAKSFKDFDVLRFWYEMKQEYGDDAVFEHLEYDYAAIEYERVLGDLNAH